MYQTVPNSTKMYQKLSKNTKNTKNTKHYQKVQKKLLKKVLQSSKTYQIETEIQ